MIKLNTVEAAYMFFTEEEDKMISHRDRRQERIFFFPVEDEDGGGWKKLGKLHCNISISCYFSAISSILSRWQVMYLIWAPQTWLFCKGNTTASICVSQRVVSSWYIHVPMVNRTNMNAVWPWERTKSCRSSERIRCCSLTLMRYASESRYNTGWRLCLPFIFFDICLWGSGGGGNLHVKDGIKIAEVRKEREEHKVGGWIGLFL